MATVKYFDTTDLTGNCDYDATGSAFVNPTGTGDLTIVTAGTDYERYTICDVVQASITGNIAYNLSGTQITFTPSLVVAGDTILTYIVDFGNG